MVNGLCNTIESYTNSSGALPLFYSVRDCIPFAFEGVMLAIFIVLFAGNYFLIKGKTGRDKIMTALMASSFLSLAISMMFALAQLITFTTVLFYTFLTIIIFILYVIGDYW